MALRTGSLGLRRCVAFALDWCVILLWGGVLFLTVYLWNEGMPERFSGPWVSQGVAFLMMTLPVILYFSLLESRSFGATLGKRAMRLRVGTRQGTSLAFRDSLQRSLIKFTPWELGHLVAQQSYYAGEGGVPAWLYLPMFLSMALPLWWITALFRRNQAPYDVFAGSVVLHEPLTS